MIKSLASIRALPETDSVIIDEAKEIRDYNTWHLQHGSIRWWNVFTQKRYLKRMAFAFIPLLGIQLSGVQVLGVSRALWIFISIPR